MSEVVGLFESPRAAQTAVERLDAMGYDAERVGYGSRQFEDEADLGVDYRDRGHVAEGYAGIGDDPGYGQEGYPDETGAAGGEIDEDYGHDDMGDEAVKGAAGGALGGAAVGTGAGLLASAGLLVVPGIGPFLAAGTLAGTLGAAAAGAAGGAAIGGVAGAIFGAGEDDGMAREDETSAHYREGVDRGEALVTVDVTDGGEQQVAGVLREIGANRVDVFGDEGWL